MVTNGLLQIFMRPDHRHSGKTCEIMLMSGDDSSIYLNRFYQKSKIKNIRSSGDMNHFITVWQLTMNDPGPKGEYIWFKFWLGSYRFLFSVTHHCPNGSQSILRKLVIQITSSALSPGITLNINVYCITGIVMWWCTALRCGSKHWKWSVSLCLTQRFEDNWLVFTNRRQWCYTRFVILVPLLFLMPIMVQIWIVDIWCN